MINLVLFEGWLQGSGLVIAFLDNGGIYLKVELQNKINGSIKINFLKCENCLAPGNAGSVLFLFFWYPFIDTGENPSRKHFLKKTYI